MRKRYVTPDCSIVCPRLNSLLDGIDLGLGSGKWDGEAAAKELPTMVQVIPMDEEDEDEPSLSLHYNIWED